jgi:NADPH:quinone reductase-like Zn-dependent oxidoreductase
MYAFIERQRNIYISSELGKGSQNIYLSLITPIFCNKKVKFPIPVNRKRSVQLIKKLLEENMFKPIIDRQYTLEQIPEACIYIEKGGKIGNVVINID